MIEMRFITMSSSFSDPHEHWRRPDIGEGTGAFGSRFDADARAILTLGWISHPQL
jgi:hypothetical protein